MDLRSRQKKGRSYSSPGSARSRSMPSHGTGRLISVKPGSLRSRQWKRFLKGPDPSLLEEFYVPALAQAIRYDRCCAYFSSSALAAAARGFGRLIERLEAYGEKASRPAVRLVVNEELPEEDVQAMMERRDFSKLEALLLGRLKNPRELLEKQRLAMLGWLVKRGWLAVRVGVMRKGAGIVHAKFGVMTDEAGDALVFNGSGNESAQGLVANYERIEISTSWEDPERYREYAGEFEALWSDLHPDVHTVRLPEALRLKLIRFAPEEPPVVEPSNALARQKTAMIWKYILEAPYLPHGETACDATALVELWPHQRKVVEETAKAWPEGRLLCDEVGMGKTIEAILVLRRLMAGRGVRRVLVLLPAFLLKQWQAELREKGAILAPRLEGQSTLLWPDGRSKKVKDLHEALKEDLLLMSRETARTGANAACILAAEPWDLVILDESHAARRRKQEEGEFNTGTLLLELLRKLQLKGKTRGFLLLSATPMQTHPWEPWDLLSVLGEGGVWLGDFSAVRDFYEAVARIRREGFCDSRTARKAARVIASDERFPPPPEGQDVGVEESAVARLLCFVQPRRREEVVRWLRLGSPLGRRMHRNTRATLRAYHERGLLAEAPPTRRVEDIRFSFQDQAERTVYEAVAAYIERRFAELEEEKPGKGFVMTVYRRRASSSPLALERSLERRRQGLLRVIQTRAYDYDLSRFDVPEALDPDDLPEHDGGKVSSALPQDPAVARRELEEVESLLSQLRGLGGRDSKRDRFYEVLRKITDDGRAALVFTEYVDTMEYIRDNLLGYYGTHLGCYSGDGGQRWDGEGWRQVTKDAITSALRDGELRVLVCSDAASEGLNLQAAGAVINYDLPWNPSKVEQRIGRIDRIGQKLEEVRVVNLFLQDSVDDRVYRALRQRCGLFEHFVGPMQPVLAKARRMLLGEELPDPKEIDEAASRAEQDHLAREIYLEGEPHGGEAVEVALELGHIREALLQLKGEFGPRAKAHKGEGRYELSGHGSRKVVFSDSIEVLERDQTVIPLSPMQPVLRDLATGLWKEGERLPLVVGSAQMGAFRRSVAYWVGKGSLTQVESFQELEKLIQAWDGTYPDPGEWVGAEQKARREAQEQVRHMDEHAGRLERQALERQLAAARARLLKELGRYLLCLDSSSEDLNTVFYRHMSRDVPGAERLRRCYDRLGGYPAWPESLRLELEEFVNALSDNQRKARLLGNELDAALEDPRWEAVATSVQNTRLQSVG